MCQDHVRGMIYCLFQLSTHSITSKTSNPPPNVYAQHEQHFEEIARVGSCSETSLLIAQGKETVLVIVTLWISVLGIEH